MKESRVHDFLSSVSILSVYVDYKFLWLYLVRLINLTNISLSVLWQLSALQYRKMDFEEFCAAALSVHQLEGLVTWEQHARSAYELFEKDGNRAIVIDELASVC